MSRRNFSPRKTFAALCFKLFCLSWRFELSHIFVMNFTKVLHFHRRIFLSAWKITLIAILIGIALFAVWDPKLNQGLIKCTIKKNLQPAFRYKISRDRISFASDSRICVLKFDFFSKLHSNFIPLLCNNKKWRTIGNLKKKADEKVVWNYWRGFSRGKDRECIESASEWNCNLSAWNLAEIQRSPFVRSFVFYYKLIIWPAVDFHNANLYRKFCAVLYRKRFHAIQPKCIGSLVKAVTSIVQDWFSVHFTISIEKL